MKPARKPDVFSHTQHGFLWGPAVVERVAHLGGSVWINIKSRNRSILIRVKGTGVIEIDGKNLADVELTSYVERK